MLYSAFATAYFPLTLTLSLRERESRFRVGTDACSAHDCWANSGSGVIERRWTVLPLPKGEGRGEGEPSVVNPNGPINMRERKKRSSFPILCLCYLCFLMFRFVSAGK